MNNFIHEKEKKPTEACGLPFAVFPEKGRIISDGGQKKILLISTHCHQYDGNSKVSWNMLKLLSLEPDLKVVHFGIIQAKKINLDFRHYPANVKYYSVSELTEDPYGLDILEGVVNSVKPDTIVLFNNLEIIKIYIEKLKDIFSGRLVGYLDMCYYTTNSKSIDILNSRLNHIFTNSLFWKRNLEHQGITIPISIFPYGFDKKCFPALDKILTRERIGLPIDAFLIFNPNKNSHKHRYDILISAFVRLIAKYPTHNINLFCMCDKGTDGGYPILEIYLSELRKYNLGIEPHRKKILLGLNDHNYPDHIINSFYNCAHIGISCSDSDGGTLAAMEMMGVGVPQILPKSGCYEEFANTNNTQLLPIKQTYYVTNDISSSAGEARAVDVNDVFLALEKYLLLPSLVEEHSLLAKETVSTMTWEKAAVEFLAYLKN
jgi:hypothetical protein